MATKIFISWSGALSKQLAESVRQWLPNVLQSVRPYFTPTDIEKGARWFPEISGELATSDIGIVCLTKDNVDKPWILFEAGALSKNLDKSRLCAILFNLETAELKGPLTTFQNVRFEKQQFKDLIKTINSAGQDYKLTDATLDKVFEMWWPDLEERVKQVFLNYKNPAKPTDRSDRDMLEEVLALTRFTARASETDRKPNMDTDVLMDLASSYERLRSSLRRSRGNDDIMELVEGLGNPVRYLCRGIPEPVRIRARAKTALQAHLEEAFELPPAEPGKL